MLFVVKAVDDGDSGVLADLVHDVTSHAVLLKVVQTNHQSVEVTGKNQTGVGPSFLILALHGVLAVILSVAAKLSHTSLKGDAGTGGGLCKEHTEGLVLEQLVSLTDSVLALQLESYVQNGLDLFTGEVLKGNKISSAHVCSHSSSPFLLI